MSPQRYGPSLNVGVHIVFRTLFALVVVALPLVAGVRDALSDETREALIAALLESDGAPPEGYIRQKLDVTDGLIFMPKDWFYNNHGTPSGWMWTLSKEDSSKGNYLTGQRIQMFTGVSKGTGLSPGSFARQILEQRRKAASSVISECTPNPVGQFMRQCHETIEDSSDAPKGKFHIEYSVFWGGDIVVVATFGAPAESWESVKPIAETMAAFRFIGRNVGN